MHPQDLLRFNEWWETGRVNPLKVPAYRRKQFAEVERLIGDRQMIIISGLRRVGKTCLMYQLIQLLLDRGVDPRHIFYFSFDEEGVDIKEVLEAYSRYALGGSFALGRAYLFLDEVQKVRGWDGKVKVYYDLYPELKIVISGSAALALGRRRGESLAGRSREVTMEPLTFREYLEMEGALPKFSDAALFNERMLGRFEWYLDRYGFPEVAREADAQKVRDYIRQLVVERATYRDVPREFGRTDAELLEKLSELFFANPGMMLNVDRLARDMRRDRRTVTNYVRYLRFAMLIRTVRNGRGRGMAASRKCSKVYPATPSIASAYAGRPWGSAAGVARGLLMELAVCAEGIAGEYYRKGGVEIDFIVRAGDGGGALPIEVKASASERDLGRFARVVKSIGCSTGIMATWRDFGEFALGGVSIRVWPLWALLAFSREVLGEALGR